MKKLVYLLLVVSIMFSGVVAYAALPYQENIKRVTLYTYDGIYTTRRYVENYSRMENVLKVISDKKETDKTVGEKEKLTNLELSYADGSVKKVVFYGNNIIGVTENGTEVMYEVDYGSDIEATIIAQFSDIKVGSGSESTNGNPQTGDNVLLIGGLLIVTSCVAFIAYRKTRLS
ncbi:MAG: hypothetical protein IJO43_00295 [Bacilli bacterium]|nr:hypothetical protein [Bacilli bacterium]